MLSAPAVDIHFNNDDDDWIAPASGAKLYRAASVGNSWGVTSIGGRGYDWNKKTDEEQDVTPTQPDAETLRRRVEQSLKDAEDIQLHFPTRGAILSRKNSRPITSITTSSPEPRSPSLYTSTITAEPTALNPSPVQSRTASPHPLTPNSPYAGFAGQPSRPPSSRSSTGPRPRRRSSQQRVSLVAGQVSIAPVEPPSPPPPMSLKLQRQGSQSSFLSVADSVAAPDNTEKETFLGGRSISEFVIEGQIGRGAYGLVKRAREKLADGALGPPLIIKQIIKSRILADCWKRHPKYGTIPIEIYVMSAISSISYVLPAKRPWDPSRPSLHKAPASPVMIPLLDESVQPAADDPDAWVEGKTIKGHPNICPLLDFFEDNHYYYLVLPSTTPGQEPDEAQPATDLFDLVESYPQGLPPPSIRSYLGQIADALSFLHSEGIVHRDVKDENVVLGPAGKATLIDFGSSGLVKKKGWDTFSGTLDYAGPEILRGERYYGKEQDVWAFGVVAYVLLVGECPFTTAAEAQEGLGSPFSSASIALDERCGDDHENVGEEEDGGGMLGDAAVLVRACLEVEVSARPSFDTILQSRFLRGNGGWGVAKMRPPEP